MHTDDDPTQLFDEKYSIQSAAILYRVRQLEKELDFTATDALLKEANDAVLTYPFWNSLSWSVVALLPFVIHTLKSDSINPKTCVGAIVGLQDFLRRYQYPPNKNDAAGVRTTIHVALHQMDEPTATNENVEIIFNFLRENTPTLLSFPMYR